MNEVTAACKKRRGGANSRVPEADETPSKVNTPRPLPEPGVALFLGRLSAGTPGAVRLAVLDLIRQSPRGADRAAAAGAMAAALANAADEATALALIRGLEALGGPEQTPALAAVRDDRSRPAAVRHAALLAHDSLEVAPGT